MPVSHGGLQFKAPVMINNNAKTKYNSLFFSTEIEVFVTAIDHSNVIFFVCISFEKRDPACDLSWGESCYLRIVVWKWQVKQVILKMELLNSLYFSTLVAMNKIIYLEPL